jgi:hypothetical protein
MKPLITILVGPPGSGKSTWANNYLKTHGYRDSLVYINQDTQGKEDHKKLFLQAIADKKDIVVDRMNFSKKQRNIYLEPAKQAKYDTRIIVFHESYENCLDRCKAREDHPTITTKEDVEKAVHFFFTHYGRVKDCEADEVMRLGWADISAEKVIVCDLDGTLANVDHRRHFVRPPEPVNKPTHRLAIEEETSEPPKKFKPNWMGFFEAMTDDPVNEWCRSLLSAMNKDYRIVYATGRPADYSRHTTTWLTYNNLWFNKHTTQLYMRNKKDYRSDDQIKEIILDFELKTRYNILFVVDDRQQVVDMWRKHGYTVLQCDKGDF